jgi:uncharacterized membrane protein YccC
MQADEERTLHNLCVLAALSHNDKLCTLEEHFTIYSPTSMRGLVRFWYGERRDQNVQRVRATVRAALGFAQKTVEDAEALRAAEAATLQLRIDALGLQHVRIVDALRAACDGIRNLRQTYREDAALVSQLTLLVQEVDDVLLVLRRHTEARRAQLAPRKASPPPSPSRPRPPPPALLLPSPQSPA